MSQKDEIKDDEIRVISQSGKSNPGGNRRFSRTAIILIAIGIVLVLLLTAVRFFLTPEQAHEEIQPQVVPMTEDVAPALDSAPAAKAYTEVTDTTVGNVRLTILTPHDATPVLAVGSEELGDASVVLMAQAADVRADNGEIVGAFVLNGDVVGRGERKGGFCAIIDGKITIGVAESTPLLEEAINTKGYFFRQYPLVVAGQVVENKPKGRALRKALADLNGTPVVILSHSRLTFHEFSQALVDLGVSTAIYLVGSSGYCSYRTEAGKQISTGFTNRNAYEMLNFIVWK